jgi:hypothetical protein
VFENTRRPVSYIRTRTDSVPLIPEIPAETAPEFQKSTFSLSPADYNL